MEFVHFDDVIELGEVLVNELRIDEHADTLCRWMAHYVAQLILEVRNSSDEDKPEALKKCKDEILSLWEHRSSFPPGSRPLETFEPIFQMLEQMDVSANNPYYFRLPEYDEDEQSEFTKQWLDTAIEFDKASRLLLKYCIVKAAQQANDQEQEWIRIALKPAFRLDYQSRVLAELCGLVRNDSSTMPEEEPKIQLTKLCDKLNDMITTIKSEIGEGTND